MSSSADEPASVARTASLGGGVIDEPKPDVADRETLILDAVIALLASGGIAAVSMRAVAKQAGVALGLMNYHFANKTSLIAAALVRIGEEDRALVAPTPGLDAVGQLQHALRIVASDEYLQPDYLGLRLQLWSLAPVDPLFAAINRDAQIAYRDGLAALIANANPDLASRDVERRAADILIVQNGMWVTSILIVDAVAISRGVERCERIALGP